MSKKIRILVSDGNQKHTLGIVRALGQNQRYLIDVFCTHKKPIASYSKYVNRTFILPDYQDTEFLNAFSKVVKDNKHDVFFPVGSRAFECAVHNNDFFKNKLGLKLLTPNFEQFEIAMSKEATRAFADKQGLTTPKTIKLKALSDLGTLTSSLSYPVVIKAQREMGINVVDYAHNDEELTSKYHRQVAKHQFTESELPLIQEYVKGTGEGYFALCVEGQILSQFQHRRVREYPPTGGMSTCAISTNNEAVQKAGSHLLQQLKWTGVAMVEFKVSSDNVPYLLEINPKYWGSHDLALAASIDFPNQAMSLLLDNYKSAPVPYKIGVKYHWPLHGDIQHAFMRPAHVYQVIKDSFDPRVKSNLWLTNDVLPTLAMVPNLLGKLWKILLPNRP